MQPRSDPAMATLLLVVEAQLHCSTLSKGASCSGWVQAVAAPATPQPAMQSTTLPRRGLLMMCCASSILNQHAGCGSDHTVLPRSNSPPFIEHACVIWRCPGRHIMKPKHSIMQPVASYPQALQELPHQRSPKAVPGDMAAGAPFGARSEYTREFEEKRLAPPLEQQQQQADALAALQPHRALPSISSETTHRAHFQVCWLSAPAACHALVGCQVACRHEGRTRQRSTSRGCLSRRHRVSMQHC